MQKLNKNKRIYRTLVVITGGARGIGKSIASSFLKEGAVVIVTSRNAKFTSSPVQEGNVNLQFLDVTNLNSVENFFKWLSDQKYVLSTFINNAGTGIFKPILETSLSEWEIIISTNLTGAFLCTKECFRIMQNLNGGRIINIGSIADAIGIPCNSVYAASKSGLRGFSATLSEEGSINNIRVTYITLGAVYTDIWKKRKGFFKKDMIEKDNVSDIIIEIAKQPLNVRIDNIEITPGKKIL